MTHRTIAVSCIRRNQTENLQVETSNRARNCSTLGTVAGQLNLQRVDLEGSFEQRWWTSFTHLILRLRPELELMLRLVAVADWQAQLLAPTPMHGQGNQRGFLGRARASP